MCYIVVVKLLQQPTASTNNNTVKLTIYVRVCRKLLYDIYYTQVIEEEEQKKLKEKEKKNVNENRNT